MTEPNGRTNTFTYDSMRHTSFARNTTVFMYEGSSPLVPAGERTTFIYEVDGKGSAVLRETIPARSPSEILAAMQSAPLSARTTFMYSGDVRRISEEDVA